MKKILTILLGIFFFGGITNISYADEVKHSDSFCKQQITEEMQNPEDTCSNAWCNYIKGKCLSCPGIRLNTNIPFIGNCITADSQSEVFPTFIGGLIKFTTSLLLLVGFICILVGGVLIASDKVTEGRNLIMKVARALAAVGASGIILKIINPNFFS